MFEKMLEWIKNTILRLMGQQSTDLTITPKMSSLISLWADLYGGKGSDQPLRLPASIAAEFARLVVVESEIAVTGSGRGDWLMEQLLPFLSRLREYVEYGCALGGEVFKPYVSGDKLLVDVVQADCFFPTAFDSSGRMTGAVFTQQIVRENRIFTRAESHVFQNGSEVIQNKAFSSTSSATLGGEIPLTTVPEWADISPQATISDIDRPLFAYFRIPLANNKDRHSPLGISVFANAVKVIEDANQQYQRLMWEYNGGQLAIDVSAGAIRKGKDGSYHMRPAGTTALPPGSGTCRAGKHLLPRLCPTATGRLLSGRAGQYSEKGGISIPSGLWHLLRPQLHRKDRHRDSGKQTAQLLRRV